MSDVFLSLSLSLSIAFAISFSYAARGLKENIQIVCVEDGVNDGESIVCKEGEM